MRAHPWACVSPLKLATLHDTKAMDVLHLHQPGAARHPKAPIPAVGPAHWSHPTSQIHFGLGVWFALEPRRLGIQLLVSRLTRPTPPRLIGGMRLFSVAAMLGSILLAGCATPKPPEFGEVPGPSKTLAVLPREAATVPPTAEEHKPAVVEKPKPAPAKPPKVTPVEKTAAVEKQKPAPKPKRKPATSPAPDLVTPDVSLTGKVSRYNEAGRFVVLEFPIAHLPGVGQTLFVYRNGLKVGEVKVTGPQRDDHTVADLSAGEAQVGDEVREQ